MHHRQVIRVDLTLVPDPLADLGEGVPAPGRGQRDDRRGPPRKP